MDSTALVHCYRTIFWVSSCSQIDLFDLDIYREFPLLVLLFIQFLMRYMLSSRKILFALPPVGNFDQ